MKAALTSAAWIGMAVSTGGVPLFAQLQDNTEKHMTCGRPPWVRRCRCQHASFKQVLDAPGRAVLRTIESTRLKFSRRSPSAPATPSEYRASAPVVSAHFPGTSDCPPGRLESIHWVAGEMLAKSELSSYSKPSGR